MGRIFLSAGHDLIDPGAIAFGTTESKEMMLTRDLIAKELEAQGAAFLSVPDNLNLRQTIQWINSQARAGDVAIIPIDLVEQLRIKIAQNPEVRQIRYGGIVYVKAVDLQPFNVAIGWDGTTKTVILNTVTSNLLDLSDQIMGFGKASEEQMKSFLQDNNEGMLARYLSLPKLYIEEAEIEGVNYDIAFCQMCLETGFLRFGGQVKPEQNNFCGLGAIDGGAAGASFPDPRTGVKAHIEHLKAYGSTNPIKRMPIVDPRFHLVGRGSAVSVHDLGGYWASDRDYGKKIMALMRRLHTVV